MYKDAVDFREMDFANVKKQIIPIHELKNMIR